MKSILFLLAGIALATCQTPRGADAHDTTVHIVRFTRPRYCEDKNIRIYHANRDTTYEMPDREQRMTVYVQRGPHAFIQSIGNYELRRWDVAVDKDTYIRLECFGTQQRPARRTNPATGLPEVEGGQEPRK